MGSVRNNIPSMAKWTTGVGLLVTLVSLQLLMISRNGVDGKSLLPQQLQQQGSLNDEKPGAFVPEMDLGDDEGGTVEASILNYLYTKNMLQRMRQQLELADPVKKRNYWKQCAFNAVSCFGKK